MLSNLTIEDQLELIKLAKARVEEVIVLIKAAMDMLNSNTNPSEIHNKLDEALVVIQGPKKKTDGSH